ncbi:ABC transporter substrate-binding protein [Spirosoma sp. BT702]|uniref:ABC transporter substrate-binding protein n=1 Tax=Spirosoma profusum TaxID=2771354 RepID=A0A926Y362_9BACT|nr:ABC transporter substrate-binding protein [Spirosoma profusum]MBD2703113.1 ABC transporter substrate-binding protein [Spirosoma profusum]
MSKLTTCWRYVLVLSIVFTFSGCQSTDTKLTRLSGWSSNPVEEKLVAGVLADFHREKPAVNFKYEPIPGNYTEKIQLMLGTHTAPDVFYLRGETAPSYMRFNVLEPLNQYAADTTFRIDDFYPALLKSFQKGDTLYGVPKDFNPYVLFYNKAMFGEAGLTHPPQNWKELEAFSRRMTKDTNGDGKPDQYGLVLEPTIEMIMAFVYQNGGDFQKEDGTLGILDKNFLDALEYYVRLYRTGAATIPSDLSAKWNGECFGTKKCAMVISSGWLIPELRTNYNDVDWGVAELPVGRQKATIVFTNAYAMPKESIHKKDGWQIIDYLTSQDGLKSVVKQGLALPPRRSVAQNLGLYNDPVKRVFLQSAEFARTFQTTLPERWYEEASVALQMIYFDNKTPREAMEALNRQIESGILQ